MAAPVIVTSAEARGFQPYGCTGKTAVVLGGTRGIGLATSQALAAAHAVVIPSGRDFRSSSEVAEALKDAGGEAHAVAIDITDVPQTRKSIANLDAAYGGIDILIANAGINPYFVRAEDVTVAMWDELMAVNLRGLFFAIQAAATGMLERKSGSIVCVSSAVSGIGIHRGLPYVATKGGVDAMVPSLAYEWADRGVRVNSVAPGYIATDLTQGLITNSSLRSMLLDRTPLQRFGSPEEVAGLICYLASDASAFVTGQRFIIDGGFSIS